MPSISDGDFLLMLQGRTSQNFSRVPMSQYKTYTRTTVRRQNMYTYHCQNTKHVQVLPSQNKTCTLTTVTIQNIYTYQCHNTKHVHVPLSQFQTCTRNTVTIQNTYTYHSHNMKHVHLAANINAYFPLPNSEQKLCANLRFRSCCFCNVARLADRRQSILILEQ